MNKKNKVLFKNLAIFALGSVGSKLILFLLVPVYTNYMTKDEYGIADLVFTVGQILVPFVSAGIFNAVIRFGISKNYKRENVLRNACLIAAAGTVLMVSITPVFGLFPSLREWKWFLFLYVISDLYSSIGCNYLKAKENNRAYAFISIIRTAVLAGLNIFLLVFLNKGVRGYLSSTIIASGVAFIFAVIAGKTVTDLRRSHPDRSLLKEMLAYSAPLILNGVSWWVIHSSDKIMIKVMISAAALGLFSVAGKIPSVINVIVWVFSQAWDISSIKEIEDARDTGFFARVFSMYSFSTFLVAIIAIGLTKPFMAIYVGAEFRECWVFVPLLLVSAANNAIATYFGCFYTALKKSRLSMYSTLVAAAVNVVVNFSLIPFIGIWGAVIGTLVSYIALALFRMITVLKLIAISIDLRSFIISYLLVLAAAIAVSLDFYVYISSAVVLVLFIAVNRKYAVETIKKAAQTVSGLLKKGKQ
ncbi:MAG: oligosaccharide flippase family protein [Clostridia bacterium]|nr:oligosaccharide flippase family protein [Clostridia bacterium]